MFTVTSIGIGCARKSGAVTAKFPEESKSAAATTSTADKEAEARLGEGAATGFEEGDLALLQSNRPGDLVFTDAGESLKSVYFDYDSSALSPEAKATLEQVAQWLKQNPTKNIRIEGNCDERGTTEYNLALGERRSLAARRYLISLGISSDRIFTISYGEEKPAVDGHDESAWKFNRRDDFAISL
ncbi:MAG: peptidoglycan-associated lipoprotein Pal [Candidatus Abyssobacteria bacterium SURF_5]|uniref:Peptidoglycan-associated protein n=1 Tax=Abyssobacteria bacterium (strain SURF_5) TaxID=2093360 RepID=A0A3A4PAZ9_ABYX5|nr:MAG: peptidoglycan-associated lipoprotein Pal [Candidatus Abyssubacteria bacterium SURF_5]